MEFPSEKLKHVQLKKFRMENYSKILGKIFTKYSIELN